MRKSTSSYDKDFFGWCKNQSDLLKKKEYSKVDWENVIDEIESLGRSEKRTITSFLSIYFLHLLKKKYQPNLYCRSWELSIKYSHEDFLKELSKNPGMKPKLEEIRVDAYKDAIREACKETGLDESIFPKKCPWSISEILKEKK